MLGELIVDCHGWALGGRGKDSSLSLCGLHPGGSCHCLPQGLIRVARCLAIVLQRS
ncbi:hypothetical protein AWT69_002445 [Pseudomonas putida]|nr:hypothetical protein AWT69_002445 [Pseudomonas putida]